MQVLRVCTAVSRWPLSHTLSLHRNNHLQHSSTLPIPVPSRPDLFYHLVAPPTPISSSTPAFALSFLPTAPASSDSGTIIGWLPAAAQEAGLIDFKENGKFRDVLHDAIRSGVREGSDDVLVNGALQTHQGWMHIHDSRNVPALGRIGDPDDILASVFVENGKILAETYQPMPSYRLCTADGVTQLTPGLSQKLKSTLEARARAEQGTRIRPQSWS